MPSNPPTVADLEAEVASRCGVALDEAGVYLRALDGDDNPITPAIREGLRRGMKCVGVSTADPLVIADDDVANLTAFAVERVLDEAEYFGLGRALLHWHRAVQKYEEAVAPAPIQGGWLAEQKRNVRERVAQLRAILEQPYREPADPMSFQDARTAAGLEGRPSDPCYPFPYGYGWGGCW